MKYINLFDTQAAYDAAEKYYPNVSYIEASDEVVYQEIDPDYYLKQYLTFEALESGTFTLTVPANVNSTYMTSVSYSIDDGANWLTIMINNKKQTITTPTVNAGDKVLWKGEGLRMSYNSSDYSVFNSTGDFNVSGNIMSLLYGDNFARQTSFPSGSIYNFYELFYGCTKLISAGNLILPATTLAFNCYYGMFNGCTSLTTAPELPATTLAQTCYQYMFNRCTSLTTAPELPATTLAHGCYNGMFTACTSLTTAPTTLPATTLADSCYAYMFSGCSALTTSPVISATRSNSNYVFQSMFQGCSSLNSITLLLVDYNGIYMFSNWVSGVAATGTFTKAASMTKLPTGVNGIPENWTVVDATA